jgi:hypothetical protein
MSAGTFPGMGWIRLSGVPPPLYPGGTHDQGILAASFLWENQSKNYFSGKSSTKGIKPSIIKIRSSFKKKLIPCGGHTEGVASNSNYIPSNLSLYSETIQSIYQGTRRGL